MVYVIQHASRIRTEFRPEPTLKLSANLYGSYHRYVYSEKTPDDGQRNCTKHVRPDPARKLSANLYCMYHWCVYSKKVLMIDRGTVRNM